jgi:lysophospholipase L1-like esterase
MTKCVLFLGAALITTLGMTACAATPKPLVSVNYRNASVRYNGASFVDFGVSIAPFGAVSVRVSTTSTARMTAYGKGQAFQINVDGVRTGSGKLRDCGCLTTVTVASHLSDAVHLITVTNVAPRPLVFTRWTIDAGGSFRRTAVEVDTVHGTLTPGTPMSFYVRGAAAVYLNHPPSEATLQVIIDDRPQGYAIRAQGGPRPAPTGAAGTAGRTLIAWGLADGLTKITVIAESGSVQVTGVTLTQFPGVGLPGVIPDELAARAPLLAVFGDSIGDGERTLGFAKDADGFGAQLAALRGWRLAELSRAGASGTCYGPEDVSSVVAARPDAVIVAFGANDMAPGPDIQGCDPSVDEFRQAMQRVLASLRSGLPDAAIFVEAILPTASIHESIRSAWNASLRNAARAAGVPFVDPSKTLDPKIDYEDAIHPNNRGHRKIAAYWNGVLPSL